MTDNCFLQNEPTQNQSGLTPAPADSGSAADGTHIVFRECTIMVKELAAAAEPIRWAAPLQQYLTAQ